LAARDRRFPFLLFSSFVLISLLLIVALASWHGPVARAQSAAASQQAPNAQTQSGANATENPPTQAPARQTSNGQGANGQAPAAAGQAAPATSPKTQTQPAQAENSFGYFPAPHKNMPLGNIPRKPGDGEGAYKTHHYRDLFAEQGHSATEIHAKIEKAFQQLFYGDGQEERVYFETGANANGTLAYITDWRTTMRGRKACRTE
jgi:hypothetical protein